MIIIIYLFIYLFCLLDAQNVLLFFQKFTCKKRWGETTLKPL